MVEYLLVACLAFAAGIPVGSVISRRRAGRPLPAAGGAPSAEVNESITSFGEELDVLAFDPAGAEASAETVADYRTALDAYDRARSAGSGPAALAALQDGRAALIRLDARRNGRPVPLDALPALNPGAAPPAQVPVATGERFLAVGRGPGTTEVLIDRPEPGLPVIADVTHSGEGNFVAVPLIRTADRLERMDMLVNTIGEYRGRHCLPPEATHLVIDIENGPARWAVRFQPLDAALPLERERHGEGDEVLVYAGGPAVLTTQVRCRRNWIVQFHCRCGKGELCACEPREPVPWGHGGGDGRCDLTIPGPGLITVQLDDGGAWSHHVGPIGGRGTA